MNALQIINQAQDELAQTRSSSLAATDPQTRQFLALANSHGDDLMARHTWSALQTLATITTVNGTSDYTVPTDFDRFIDETQWDRTNAWTLIGPITPQLDRFRREALGGTALGPRRTIRLLGTTVRVNPTPSVAGDVLVYEYISNKWALAGSTPQATITADTNTVVFNSRLMIRGIKYRWRHAKGVEAETYKDEHDTLFDICKAGDIGIGTINMAPEPESLFLTIDSVPDTGYGV